MLETGVYYLSAFENLTYSNRCSAHKRTNGGSKSGRKYQLKNHFKWPAFSRLSACSRKGGTKVAQRRCIWAGFSPRMFSEAFTPTDCWGGLRTRTLRSLATNTKCPVDVPFSLSILSCIYLFVTCRFKLHELYTGIF